jgi:uncharacterized membrane protein YfcA
MFVYLPIAQMSVDVLLLLALGGVTGIISGMFGIGGGFLMTPLLIFMGIPPAVAVSSVATQMIASSVSGVHTHWRKGNVDFHMGSVMLVGGFIGSTLGVWIFSYLSALGQIDLVISIGYVLFLTAIGSMMAVESAVVIRRQRRYLPAGKIVSNINMIDAQWIEEKEKHSRALLRKKITLPWVMYFPRSQLHVSVLLPFGISVLIGILVSLLGLGGGFFMIPAMLYILKMPASMVIGTSLFQVIFISSNVTLLQAMTTHTVDIVLATILLIGSSIGAQVGIRLGIKLSPEYLRALLAVIVLCVAMQLFFTLTLTPSNFYSITMER